MSFEFHLLNITRQRKDGNIPKNNLFDYKRSEEGNGVFAVCHWITLCDGEIRVISRRARIMSVISCHIIVQINVWLGRHVSFTSLKSALCLSYLQHDRYLLIPAINELLLLYRPLSFHVQYSHPESCPETRTVTRVSKPITFRTI